MGLLEDARSTRAEALPIAVMRPPFPKQAQDYLSRADSPNAPSQMTVERPHGRLKALGIAIFRTATRHFWLAQCAGDFGARNASGEDDGNRRKLPLLRRRLCPAS